MVGRFFSLRLQNDRALLWSKCWKGVRRESPNIDSEDCGECRESQGSPSKAQASRWRKRNENREEIFPARERSEQGLKFPRFVAGEAFRTCAALWVTKLTAPLRSHDRLAFSLRETIHSTTSTLADKGKRRSPCEGNVTK